MQAAQIQKRRRDGGQSSRSRRNPRFASYDDLEGVAFEHPVIE
jgi:hypothetical protein